MRIADAKCILVRGKAILVEAHDFDQAEWIPQSQITDDSEVWREGDEGTLEITDWWARKKGWE